MISPKRTVRSVLSRKPTSPPVMSASRIDCSEMTATLPVTRVHNSRLPRFRIGMMAAAYLRSSGEPDSRTISSWFVSRPRSPRVRPEKSAEKPSSTTAPMIRPASSAAEIVIGFASVEKAPSSRRREKWAIERRGGDKTNAPGRDLR